MEPITQKEVDELKSYLWGKIDDLKLNDISKILDEKFNLNTHFYCAVD